PWLRPGGAIGLATPFSPGPERAAHWTRRRLPGQVAAIPVIESKFEPVTATSLVGRGFPARSGGELPCRTGPSWPPPSPPCRPPGCPASPRRPRPVRWAQDIDGGVIIPQQNGAGMRARVRVITHDRPPVGSGDASPGRFPPAPINGGGVTIGRIGTV